MIELERLLDELLAGMTVEINLSIAFKPVEPVEGAEQYLVVCPNCDWSETYESKDSAKRGLRAHAQHCTSNAQQTKSNASPTAWIEAMSHGD